MKSAEREKAMEGGKTLCVLCAWRQTCNKKFSMDGATTTRCPEFTKDLTLKAKPEDNKIELDKDGG